MRHGKCIFVPRGEYSRMRTFNLDLIMQKNSRVIQMIIAHKSVHINKAALAVEPSILMNIPCKP